MRESARGGHIWLRGLKSSQVTPTALTVFTMMFALLIPLPSLSLFLFLSLSFCLYFSFLLLCFSSLLSLFFLFFLKSRLSIPLHCTLSLSDAFARDLGHSYAQRNRIFFVAPRPKIPMVVQPWVKKRGSYTETLLTRRRREDEARRCRRERRGEVFVISRLSGIACFLESCRSPRPFAISRRLLDLAIHYQ